MSEYKKTMIEDMDLNEFRDSGMLWWVNQQLHLFGAAIAMDIDDNGNATNFRPVRCQRMEDRGDTEDMIASRVLNDSIKFSSGKLISMCKKADKYPMTIMNSAAGDADFLADVIYKEAIQNLSIVSSFLYHYHDDDKNNEDDNDKE